MIASDVPAALALIRTHGKSISLVVTDVVMPSGSGLDVARLLAKVRPQARVLYTSGYAEDAIVRDGVIDRDVAFLAKPFDGDELLARVRELLRGLTIASEPAAPHSGVVTDH
jgi:DNA-binding response OmpR family regulator